MNELISDHQGNQRPHFNGTSASRQRDGWSEDPCLWLTSLQGNGGMFWKLPPETDLLRSSQ